MSDWESRYRTQHDTLHRLEDELAASRALVEQMREALREEVKKRHHYTDGSQPDDAWLDAKIAEMYPALAAVPDSEEPRDEAARQAFNDEVAQGVRRLENDRG